jgi:hypothetical protein
MSDADEIKADIIATRAELAETADALAARVNQKAHSGLRVVAAAAGAVGLVLLVKRLRK